MHIPDGVLPAPVLLGGYTLTGISLWWSLRHIERLPNFQAQIPKASLLTAAFFVASWIHIPIPPTSVHLILNGLLGAVLGVFAMPAIVVGLFFQAVIFQHGGLTTLGINAAMMGLPALLAHTAFSLRHPILRRQTIGSNRVKYSRGIIAGLAFLAGALGILLTAAVFFGLLVTAIPSTLDIGIERAAIATLTLAHLPLAVVEGVFTSLVVMFLLRVQPQLLQHA